MCRGDMFNGTGRSGCGWRRSAAVQQMHTVPVMPVTRATLRDMFEKKRGEQQISYIVSDFSNKSVAVTVSPLGVSHEKKIRFLYHTDFTAPPIQRYTAWQLLSRFSSPAAPAWSVQQLQRCAYPVVFAVTTSAIKLVSNKQ